MSEAVAPEARGRAFGFEWAMDTVGAIVAPLTALALLSFGFQHRTIILLAAAPALVPVIHAAVAVEHAKRRLVVATEHRAAVIAPVRPHAPPRLAKVVATPPQLALAATKPADGSLAPPTPTPQPTASPAPSPVVAARDDGIGNFGETYPASIEPALRGGLIAGVGAFDVRITVDESGHAVAVDFIRAPADPALRDELRTRILAAHFIPAACNGLRCAGIVELKAAN